MNSEQILKKFLNLHVEAYKAANHCWNAFTLFRKHETFIWKENLARSLLAKGFDMTVSEFDGPYYSSLRASKENARRLLEIATVKGPSANRVRRTWTELLKPDLITSDETETKKAINKYWKGMRKEMELVLAHPISDQSLLEVYLANQAENRRLIQEFADAATIENRHTQDDVTPYAHSRRG